MGEAAFRIRHGGRGYTRAVRIDEPVGAQRPGRSRALHRTESNRHLALTEGASTPVTPRRREPSADHVTSRLRAHRVAETTPYAAMMRPTVLVAPQDSQNSMTPR